MLRKSNLIINQKLLKDLGPLREEDDESTNLRSAYFEINHHLKSIEEWYSKLYKRDYETHFI
jgi:hypothetical protein